MSNNTRTNFYIGSLITSSVGAALLSFAEFAGWYDVAHSNGYYAVDEGSIYIYSQSEASIIIGSFVVALLFCSFVSYLGMTRPEKVSITILNSAFLAAVYAALGTIMGGFMFIIQIGDVDERWFGNGYFGGVFGGILTAIILKIQVNKRIKEL